jgi:lipoprotein LprG
MRVLGDRRLVGCCLAASALLLVLVTGCGGAGGPAAAQIVSQSAAKTATVKSFHVLVTIDNVPASKSGISVTYLDGDLAVPNDLRAKISGTLSGVPLNSELIVAAGGTFLKNPFSGKWQTVSVGTNPIAFFDPAKGALAVIKGATDVSKDGSEDVGGTASYRLKATVPANALTPLLGNAPGTKSLPVELWIGKQDLLLRRIRLSGPISPAEPANAVRTVELSAFGESVHITPPATS